MIQAPEVLWLKIKGQFLSGVLNLSDSEIH